MDSRPAPRKRAAVERSPELAPAREPGSVVPPVAEPGTHSSPAPDLIQAPGNAAPGDRTEPAHTRVGTGRVPPETPPETRPGRPAEAGPGGQAPAGGASSARAVEPDALPAGPAALSGAEFRAEMKRKLAERGASLRGTPGRTRRRDLAPRYKPGQNRRGGEAT